MKDVVLKIISKDLNELKAKIKNEYKIDLDKFKYDIILEKKKFLSQKKIYEIKISNKEDNNSLETIINNFFIEMKLKLYVENIIENNGQMLINLNGEDKAIAIGKKGQTLYNLEYLFNIFFKDKRIALDIENFKLKRKETLAKLTHSIAKKLIRNKMKQEKLNYMPKFERKIIHEVVGNYENLESQSAGEFPKRYIIIRNKNV